MFSARVVRFPSPCDGALTDTALVGWSVGRIRMAVSEPRVTADSLGMYAGGIKLLGDVQESGGGIRRSPHVPVTDGH